MPCATTSPERGCTPYAWPTSRTRTPQNCISRLHDLADSRHLVSPLRWEMPGAELGVGDRVASARRTPGGGSVVGLGECPEPEAARATYREGWRNGGTRDHTPGGVAGGRGAGRAGGARYAAGGAGRPGGGGGDGHPLARSAAPGPAARPRRSGSSSSGRSWAARSPPTRSSSPSRTTAWQFISRAGLAAGHRGPGRTAHVAHPRRHPRPAAPGGHLHAGVLRQPRLPLRHRAGRQRRLGGHAARPAAAPGGAAAARHRGGLLGGRQRPGRRSATRPRPSSSSSRAACPWRTRWARTSCCATR